VVEQEHTPTTGQSRPIGGRHSHAILMIGAWALLVGGAQLYAWQHMLRLVDLLQGLITVCKISAFGPLLFIGAAALSPLLLIPAALLGSVAGLIYGPVLGVIYTIIGCNISATITYSIGRISGHSMEQAGWFGRLLRRYGPRLRKNSILGVIMLRLSFLPYDPVNYLIGMAQVRWVPFLVANTLGSLPGVIAIVIAGASVEGLEHGTPMLNITALIGAALLLLLSLGVALILRRRADRAA
jgi:uncharacterized membrane protein YdjX (TVP38/TMEM64 family)